MKKVFNLINKISIYLFSLSRFNKIVISSFLDILFVFLSLYFALIFYNYSSNYQYTYYNPTLFISCFFYIPIFVLIGFYKNLVRFLSINFIINLALGIGLYSIIFYFFNIIFSNYENFLIITALHSLLFYNLALFPRIIAVFIYRYNLNQKNKENLIIYGAGEAGNLILLQNSNYNICCFVDDDSNKVGRKINNLNIYHPTKLKNVIKKYKSNIILIAIPSLDISSRNKIISNCANLGVKIRITPSFSDLITGKAKIDDYKYISSDLLNRNISWNISTIKEFINNKKILVTGAGGSIGSELCRQIIKYLPQELILLDNNEFNLFKIMNEIELIKSSRQNLKKIKIFYKLVDISDQDSVNLSLKSLYPDIIFHAAAYKHVSILENNKFQAIKNNIIGTNNLIKYSIKKQTKKFIFISTDKAIKPSSIMGSSKRISELLLVHSHKKYLDSKTNFSIVRFGNVINSHGSVIPIFNEQIKNGGPITVTHPEVTRYFMSIPEAVGLVLEVSTFSKHAEKFILDMGKPIKILDVAKKMIKLSGEQIYNEKSKSGIKIEFIGLRKGEKLHEELSETNIFTKTKNDHIFMDNSKDNLDNYEKLMIDINNILSSYENKKINDFFKKYIPDININ